MAGLTGKGQRSISKAQVAESLVPAVGFIKLLWKHQASAGDTTIDLSNLTTPSAEAGEGYSAPSVSKLTAVNLQQFQNNLSLESTAGPMTLFTDFKVIGESKILLLQPALEGEVFTGVIDHVPVIGNSIVDATPFSVSGTLLAGTTDFNVGTPFEVGKFSTVQHGALLVFADGQLLYRNTNNQPTGPSVDGDYYEVHAGAGLGSIIRFNTSDTEDRQISVISNGALVERPTGSQQAYLDALQGQLNEVTEVTETLAGLTPGSLSSTPTTADLKAFGDRVLENEQDIEGLSEPGSLGTPLKATASTEGAVKRNRWQVRTLASSIVGSSTDISDLRLSNLTVGKTYRLSMQADIIAGNNSGRLQAFHNGDDILQVTGGSPTEASNDRHTAGSSVIFVATATTITFDFTQFSSASLSGDGTTGMTFSMIEELNNVEQTSAFS